jgi:serine/threonine-protein kinase
MADVYLAIARGTHGVQKLAVVKRLRDAGTADRVGMFLDEARLAARLNHPNIVHTYEVGAEHGDYFIAMEYLEGQPLSAVLQALQARAQTLPDASAATIAALALRGLHYAHEFADFDGSPLGIVHRDVSPHNLFLTYGGEVKLLDFGIAKSVVESSRTETGILKGKLGYMSPEQVSLGKVDRRADVFALGAMLWEMLVGQRLFRGDPITILKRISTGEIPAPSVLRPDIPVEIESIVMKALERDPAARFQTAEEMRMALERFLRVASHEASDKLLQGLMNDLFAAVRDESRVRIRAYVEGWARVGGVEQEAERSSARPPPLSEGSLSRTTESERRGLPGDGRGASGGAPHKGAGVVLGVILGAVAASLLSLGVRSQAGAPPPHPLASTPAGSGPPTAGRTSAPRESFEPAGPAAVPVLAPPSVEARSPQAEGRSVEARSPLPHLHTAPTHTISIAIIEPPTAKSDASPPPPRIRMIDDTH